MPHETLEVFLPREVRIRGLLSGTRGRLIVVALTLVMPACDLLTPEPSQGQCSTLWAAGPSATAEIIAHRGFASCFPENTLEALERASQRGATTFEVDVWLTKDLIPVLMHDSTVDRTTSGTGYVRDFSFADLASLDACPSSGWSCRVPTVADALRSTGGSARFVLDLKGPFTPKGLSTVVKMVEEADAIDRSLFLTGSLPLIDRLARDHPKVAKAFVYFPDRRGTLSHDDLVTHLIRVRVFTVVVFLEDIMEFPHLAADFQQSGIEVIAATVRSTRQLDEVVRAGVRMVFSDLPAEVVLSDGRPAGS